MPSPVTVVNRYLDEDKLEALLKRLFQGQRYSATVGYTISLLVRLKLCQCDFPPRTYYSANLQYNSVEVDNGICKRQSL